MFGWADTLGNRMFAKLNGKAGVIDSNGKEIVPFIYYSVGGLKLIIVWYKLILNLEK